MLGFAIPSFFFFYLFDGVTTKQMIIQQFNTSNYKVEVLGRVIPKFWHGFSLELGEILVSTNNTKLFDMSNISCQLSWYDLLRGKYKIKRLEINGADIYRDNLLNNNLNNIFNFSNNYTILFSKLHKIDIKNIQTISSNTKYILNNGVLNITRVNNNDLNMYFNFNIQTPANQILKINLFSNTINFQSNLLQIKNLKINILNDKHQVLLKALSNIKISLRDKIIEFENIAGTFNYLNYMAQFSIKKLYQVPNYHIINNLSIFFNNPQQHLKLFVDNIFLDKLTSNININKVASEYLINFNTYQLLLNSNINNITFNNAVGTFMSDDCNMDLNLNSTQLAIFGGVCQYNFYKQITHFNMKGLFNNKDARFDLAIYNKQKPYLILDAALDNFDLSKFQLKNSQTIPLYNDNDNLPFYWLTWLDMQAKLKIDNFVLDRIKLHNLKTHFTIKDNTLNLDNINAKIYDGNLNGSGSVALITNNLQNKVSKPDNKLDNGNFWYNIIMRQSVYKLDLQKMFNNLFNVKAITGDANLLLNLNLNKIKSYEDLHKKLSGSVIIDANHGAFNGVDFTIFNDINNLSDMSSSKKSSTIFDNLAANFQFINGISNKSKLTFSSLYIMGVGDGLINFVDNFINYNLNIKSILPNNNQNAKSVIIPILVSGNLFNPKLNIQNMHLSSKNVVSHVKVHSKKNK